MSKVKTVKVSVQSFVTVQATKIIAITADSVTFERKKPHTSKVQEETIVVGGKRSLVAVYGVVGDAGTVVHTQELQAYHDTGAIEVAATHVDVKNDYPTRFFVQPGVSLEIVSEAFDVEAPAAE
ncbi:hypothetical protein [Ewingella americana]|uniref:Uncharacterized protein n=1 Tax=Ewingella americana TaxID=41202 RepID=A0A502GDV2_9GAMM|nr:hypothetical protein [Ewingella americana]TPG60044.1 hypothetical protein EAH77_15875 [Ewingella americana]